MVCQQAQTLMSALMDGELHGTEREQLERHLEECPDCRDLLAHLKRQDAELRGAFAAFNPGVARVVKRVRDHVASSGPQQTLAPPAASPPPHRCTVLAVDDEPYILPILKALLEREYDVLTASSAEEAEGVLRSVAVDILLTDQKMPGRSGIELLEWAQVNRPEAVRVLMTGYSDLDQAIGAINRGHVYSYLTKPWRNDEVFHILRNAAEKRRLEHNRDYLLGELQRLNRELEDRVAERTRELEEANQLLEQRARELERMALTDPLTGLLNRRAVDDLASFELKRHARYPSPLSIGYVDIDHFKDVNTEYLYTGGDEILKAVARVLSGTIRQVDTVGRVGGEEFLVIARETNWEGAVRLAERIRSQVERQTFHVGSREVRVTVSAGFAVAEAGVPADYKGMLDLAADAIAKAKKTGRNRCEVWRVQMRDAG